MTEDLSWYLNLNINDIRNIFSTEILPYEIDVYSCECGKNEFIIKQSLQDLNKYICSECENKKFLDATKYKNNYIWYDPIKELLDDNIILSLKPTTRYDENSKKLEAKICLDIPSSVDLSCDKIYYKSKSIFELEINNKGKIKQTIQANYDLASECTYKELELFESVDDEVLINRNIYLSTFKSKILVEFKKYSEYFKSKILDKTSSVEEFSFFIRYSYLQDVDFYKWKNIDFIPNVKNINVIEALDFIGNYRKEKSFKKLVFENYKYQLKKYNKYNFAFVYSISRCIKDVNILNRMVKLKLNSHLEELNNPSELYYYLKFLCSRFTDKQVEKLFISYEKEEMFWLIDSLALFSEISDFIDEFKTTKCKYDILHTDIVRYHRMILNKAMFEINFDYEEKYLKACCNIENYSIKLPTNGTELYNWSYALENCLSGYWKLIKEKKTIVYGFTINDEVKFAVEIRNNKIIQSKSKYNKDLQNKEMSLVHGWYKEYFEEN